MGHPPTTEQQTAIDIAKQGDSCVIEALAGCLAADTKIAINRGGKGYQDRIDNIVSQLGGNGSLRGGRQWDLAIPTLVSRAVKSSIRLGTISNAWCSGVKQTFTLETVGMRSIRATDEHPFLTPDGWKRLGELRPGDIVCVNAGVSQRGRGPKRNYRYTTTAFHPHQVRNSVTGHSFKVPTHRLVVEAEMNSMDFESYVLTLRGHFGSNGREGLQFLDPALHVHHLDHDTLNNDPSNLKVMTEEEHHQLHAADGDEENVLQKVGEDTVKIIAPYGREITYDIEVANDPHNFVANGFIVHNTGKTSTLQFIAEELPRKNIMYVAFNKAIVAEASERFPGNVTARTAHSLAYGAVGKNYRSRMNAGRVRSDEIARALRIENFVCKIHGTNKILSYQYLAGLVVRSIDRFCQTADPVPCRDHVPFVNGLDEIEVGPGGKAISKWGPNQDALRRHLEPYLVKAWEDLNRSYGTLRFSHNHYLKIWQLSKPDIYADIILYDEAQDANGCMLDIVNSQRDSQLIFVGDTYQQIYEWNGAVNALANADPNAPRTHLTESFRFGSGIAMFANKALEWLGAEIELKGRSTAPQFVGPLPDPDAHLFRTNAKAVAETMRVLRDGGRPALVGGAQEVVNFAKAAEELRAGKRTQHPELACFDTWGEVQAYVDFDPAGTELKGLVDLVDDYGADVIIEALDRTVNEKDASVVISTAHKSKGREWTSVKLAGDFPDPAERDLTPEDVRLLYVSATRAKQNLDPTQVGFFDFQRGDDN